MRTGHNSPKELVLEVQKNGYRRRIYRTDVGNRTMLYLEESELIDFSRPLTEDDDYNVFFTLGSFWKSFTDFTSNEGLLNRQVWHEANHEWLSLDPIFIHPEIKHVVQTSLAEATQNLEDRNAWKIDGIRSWLRKLSEPSNALENMVRSSKMYRHAV